MESPSSIEVFYIVLYSQAVGIKMVGVNGILNCTHPLLSTSCFPIISLSSVIKIISPVLSAAVSRLLVVVQE